MVDHDAFDVFLQRKNPHAFESVRAFISGCVSIATDRCFFVFFDLDRIRSSARWIWSFYFSFRPDSNRPIKSVSGFVSASNSELSKNLPRAWNGSETHPWFVTRRISRRRSARFHGRVDTSRLAGRGAVRACATLSAPQERRRIHASRFHLPRSSSRSWPP